MIDWEWFRRIAEIYRQDTSVPEREELAEIVLEVARGIGIDV